MASYTLYRCDYCGQTRDSKKGFVAAQICPERLPNSFYAHRDMHPSSEVEVCSMDCFLGWANTRARDEFTQLLARLPKPKKSK